MEIPPRREEQSYRTGSLGPVGCSSGSSGNNSSSSNSSGSNSSNSGNSSTPCRSYPSSFSFLCRTLPAPVCTLQLVSAPYQKAKSTTDPEPRCLLDPISRPGQGREEHEHGGRNTGAAGTGSEQGQQQQKSKSTNSQGKDSFIVVSLILFLPLSSPFGWRKKKGMVVVNRFDGLIQGGWFFLSDHIGEDYTPYMNVTLVAAGVWNSKDRDPRAEAEAEAKEEEERAQYRNNVLETQSRRCVCVVWAWPVWHCVCVAMEQTAKGRKKNKVQGVCACIARGMIYTTIIHCPASLLIRSIASGVHPHFCLSLSACCSGCKGSPIVVSEDGRCNLRSMW